MFLNVNFATKIFTSISSFEMDTETTISADQWFLLEIIDCQNMRNDLEDVAKILLGYNKAKYLLKP